MLDKSNQVVMMSRM